MPASLFDQSIIDNATELICSLADYQRLQQNELGTADFTEADLSFANLAGVNLAGANLKNATLIGADLRNTDLTKANLNGANLRGANLSGAQIAMASLIGVDLQGANLTNSSLDAATLSQACLRGADLRGAYLVGVDLSESRLDRSYYSRSTCFQKGFSPQNAAMRTEVELTFGQVILQLNQLSAAAKSYLGDFITARYWEASRSNINELVKFEVKKPSATVTYTGDQNSRLNFSDLQYSQAWVNQFIHQCSQVVRNFPTFLDHQQVNYTLSAL